MPPRSCCNTAAHQFLGYCATQKGTFLSSSRHLAVFGLLGHKTWKDNVKRDAVQCCFKHIGLSLTPVWVPLPTCSPHDSTICHPHIDPCINLCAHEWSQLLRCTQWHFEFLFSFKVPLFKQVQYICVVHEVVPVPFIPWKFLFITYCKPYKGISKVFNDRKYFQYILQTLHCMNYW